MGENQADLKLAHIANGTGTATVSGEPVTLLRVWQLVFDECWFREFPLTSQYVLFRINWSHTLLSSAVYHGKTNGTSLPDATISGIICVCIQNSMIRIRICVQPYNCCTITLHFTYSSLGVEGGIAWCHMLVYMVHSLSLLTWQLLYFTVEWGRQQW
jgi:hypothetical protein